MALQIASLFAKIGADVDEAVEGLNSVKSQVRDLGQGLTDLGTKMTLGLTLPLTAAAGFSIDAASDMSESLSKTRVIFGDLSGEMEAFADTANQSMGMAEQSTLDAVSTFGNLFDSMGIGEQTAADMSKSVVQLGVDWTSFANLESPEVALKKFQSAMAGQFEPLQELGINLNASMVQLKAVEMGLVETTVSTQEYQAALLDVESAQQRATEAAAKYGSGSIEARQAQMAVVEAQGKVEEALQGTTGELTTAAKAQATWALIMEQSSNAMGDYNRTSEGLANSSRRTTALLQDAAAAMGNNLLPISTDLVHIANSLLEGFLQLDPGIQMSIVGFGAAAAAAGPLLVLLGSLATGAAALGAALSGPLLPVVLVLGAGLVALGANFEGLTRAFTSFQTGMQAGLGTFDSFKLAISQILPPEIRSIVFGFLDGFYSKFGEMKSTINDFVSTIRPKLAEAFQALGEISGTFRRALDELAASLGFGNAKGLSQAFGQLAAAMVEYGLDETFKSIGRAIDTMTAAVKALNSAMQWLIDNKQAIAEGLAAGFSAFGVGYNSGGYGGGVRSSGVMSAGSSYRTTNNNTSNSQNFGIYGPVTIQSNNPNDVINQLQGMMP
jgi:uncharacterized protein YoxC